MEIILQLQIMYYLDLESQKWEHTNFEELKVNNNSVALQSQIPDISTKANVNHNHSISDIINLQTTLNGKSDSNHNHSIDEIIQEYEEEQDFEEETLDENQETVMTNGTRTITKTRTLDTILNGKSDSNQNHDSEYSSINHNHSISDITNLQTTLDGKASSSHNHDSVYSSINHNHNSEYSPIN